MLIHSKKDIHFLSRAFPNYPGFKNILMVSPEFYDVEYAINPHMKDASGKLKKVDREKAIGQWSELRILYEYLGYSVTVLAGQEGLPDMVFAANQSFPFWEKDHPAVLMSRMATPQREKEVAFFEEWYRRQGYTVFTLEAFPGVSFEGNGDALLDPSHRWIWGGYGFRTDAEVYKTISEVTHLPVLLIELTRPECYHLDTCFSILNETTVAVDKSAIAPQSLELIESVVENVLYLDPEENQTGFAGNGLCLNGKDVIVHKDCTHYIETLRTNGLNVRPIDMSEFHKGGGSVFCLKMMCF